jgi:ATP-dependent Zn protease
LFEAPILWKFSHSQEYLAFIKLAMGGRAAEEVIYGKDYVTTGASNDFQQATKIAHHMVTKLGMNLFLHPLLLFDNILGMSSLGQLYLKDTNLGSRTTYSEMNQKIEEEVCISLFPFFIR